MPTNEQNRTAKKVGEVIRSRRDELGLTLATLGKLAGIDLSQLSKVERGLGATALETYENIAREMGWSLSDLFARAGAVRRRQSRKPSKNAA